MHPHDHHHDHDHDHDGPRHGRRPHPERSPEHGRGGPHRRPGFGPGGPGFGPGGPGFGPGGLGVGFGGPGPRGEDPCGRRRHGRGRAQRGDVRAAVLLLLAEEPMHGYQLMQAVAERTGGVWRPSPGAVYPTLSQLEDEGLVEVTREGGRKQATITALGRAWVTENAEQVGDPFAAATDEGTDRPDLRGALEDVHAATRQIGRRGSDAQVGAAAEVLATARRALYLLLADGPEQAAPTAASEPGSEPDSRPGSDPEA